MFESLDEHPARSNFRSAIGVPLGAFAATQLYSTLAPLLGRVPPLLFYGVDLIALAGFVAGLALLLKATASTRSAPDRAYGSALIASVIGCGFCGWQFAQMSFPWL